MRKRVVIRRATGIEMKILVGCGLFLFLAANAPQTSVEFHTRYGSPDVERFRVRSDLMLTVEYGADGLACRMRIEARHSLSHNSLNDPEPPMDEVMAVFNEVVPPVTSGREIGHGQNVWGTCAGALPPTEYENVTLIPDYGFCQRPLVNRGVIVLFKRPACQSLPKYSEK
jgi:hypothetical protein